MKKELIIDQLDRKLERLGCLREVTIPSNGWINIIRTSLNMSLRQLAARLYKTPQNIKKMEMNEVSGAITLKSLREIATALDMDLVYAFVPKDKSIAKLIERKAIEKAKEIVLRTSVNMKLENQGNSDKRIQQAIIERAEEIKREIPKYLWD